MYFLILSMHCLHLPLIWKGRHWCVHMRLCVVGNVRFACWFYPSLYLLKTSKSRPFNMYSSNDTEWCVCVRALWGISINVSKVVKGNLCVDMMGLCVCVFACLCACACWESQCLGQSESLGAFLNGQQQHMSQLLVTLIGWKVQLVKAANRQRERKTTH